MKFSLPSHIFLSALVKCPEPGGGNRFIYLFHATRPLGQGHPNDRLEGAFGNTFSLLSVEITALRLQIVKTARVSFLKPFEHNTYEASKGIPPLI